MRVNRGVVRGVSALLGGVVLIAGMAGCARSNENLVEVFEKDPAVAVAEVVPDSGPERYEITLEDDVDTDDFSKITKRLNDISSTAADDLWTYSVRAGAWEWDLGSDEGAMKRADTAAALSALDGVHHGTANYSEQGLLVNIVAEAGVDLTSFPASVTQIAKDIGMTERIQLVVSDLHERSEIETLDPARVQTKVTVVQTAASAGEMLSFRVDDDSVNIRMRTAEGAAAASAAIDVLPPSEIPTVTITSGLVPRSTGIVAGADPVAAAAVGAVLEPITGVLDAEALARTANNRLLVVTVSDVDTAVAVQQILTADPALLLSYRGLQLTVPHADEEGNVLRAVSGSETGYVGSLEPAIELAAADGVWGSALFTPTALELTMEHDADAAEIATAAKSVAVSGQEVEILGSTRWGPVSEHAAYSFDAVGELHPDRINGYGEKSDFAGAWNDAPAL